MFYYLRLQIQLGRKKRALKRNNGISFYVAIYSSDCFLVLNSVDIPKTITCVDCGQKAYIMTAEPEFGFSGGDWVAYRCSGCGDRWDLEVSHENHNSENSSL